MRTATRCVATPSPATAVDDTRHACPECGLIVGHYDTCTLNVAPLRVRDSWALAMLIAADPAQAWTA